MRPAPLSPSAAGQPQPAGCKLLRGCDTRCLRPAPLLPSAAQVNYNLLAVNCFMAVTGIYQLQRKVRHDLEQSGKEQPTATPAAAAAAGA